MASKKLWYFQADAVLKNSAGACSPRGAGSWGYE